MSDVHDLWVRYFDTPTPELEEALVRAYLPVVSRTLDRISGTRVPSATNDIQDHVQNGYEGLLDAVRTYRDDRGTKFETWATHKIRSKVMDGLRASDALSRGARKLVREVKIAIEHLEANHHRVPTDEEIADHLDITVDDVQAALMSQAMEHVASLDALTQSQDHENVNQTIADTVLAPTDDTPHAAFFEDENNTAVRRAIATLPRRDQQIINLYYFEGLTYRNISDIMSVTESRVCQIVNRTSTVLAQRIRDDEHD